MFAIRKLSKYLYGDTGRQSIVEISEGQLYIVRPLSPKGYSELIFKDAAASIRRTGQDYQYHLVIQRAYEDGEAELLEEEEGLESSVDALSEKDEKVFDLHEDLHFRVDLKDTGDIVLAWRDLSGDPGDLYEFVCDVKTRPETATHFELTAAKCQYERKYRRGGEDATPEDLIEFAFDDEPAIPQASPLASPGSRSQSLALSPSHSGQQLTWVRDEDASNMPHTPSKSTPSKALVATSAPASRKAPKAVDVLVEDVAELHLFDFTSGTFILQEDSVTAIVSSTGNWKYWLQIEGQNKAWLGQEVVSDINPVFNYEHLSFIFNHYTDDGSAYSWLLKFDKHEALEAFQEGLMQALWEHLNETKWHKAVQDADRDYVLDAFNDLVLEDVSKDDRRELEAAEEDEAEESETEESEYDDEEDEAYDEHVKDTNTNSALAVGATSDRSFVIRGDKIGVFAHAPGNQLKFSTSINNVSTPKGKAFSPKRVMLHAQDSNMILQNERDPNSLYRMDLETGKVVDEWKVHDDIPVNIFTPGNKFAQTTAEQTFLGLSKNALYRIDPRLAGAKLVDSELKQYASGSKNDFSAAATTEKGYIAVATAKGEIKMFDRLGINAKTSLPGLGEAISGLDVSADGRYVLATTKNYLLLIDSLQTKGKNEGKLGFEKSFAKDDKPQPRRLALSPQHVAQFRHITGMPVSFTPARFNTGESQTETSIITATGPFIVTWNLKKVLRGQKDPYSIKRYEEEVKADNFRFGSNKDIVVALPNEVSMVARHSLQKPTRESMLATETPRRSTRARGSYLRNEIVNSPY